MKVLKIFSFFIITLYLSAQSEFAKFPYAEHLPVPGGTVWDFQTNSYGLQFFATDEGIVIRNDKHYQLFRYKRPLRKIRLLSDKKLLFATRGDLGIFEISGKGATYRSFAKYLNKIDRNFGDVFEILTDDEGSYYFITDNKILKFFNKNGLRDYKIFNEGAYLGAGQLGKTPVVALADKGLINLRTQKVINSSEIFKTDALSEFVFIENKYFFASYDKNRLYSLSSDGKTLHPFPTKSDALLQKNEIYKLRNVGGNLAVLTYYGGIFIFSPQGKLLARYTSQNAKISPTAYAIGSNRSRNLLVSHANGTTEIFTSLPLSDYSSFTKNIGEINSLLAKKDYLYLATTQGTYVLRNRELQKIIPSESWDIKEYQGKILIATLDGVYQITGENPSLFENLTNAYKLDVQKNFLYIFTTEGIFKYSGNQALKKFSVKLYVPTGIYEINKNEALITTLSSGVVLWDSKKDKYKTKLFEEKADAQTGLITYKDKVLLYTSRKIYTLSTDKKLTPASFPLPSDIHILKLQTDKQGNLWILNKKYPLIFTDNKLVRKNLSRFFEGVQNTYVSEGKIFLSVGNKLYALASRQAPGTTQNKIILNFVSHQGDTVFFYEPLENYVLNKQIPYTFNRLQISYGIPASIGKNEYSYELSGNTSPWSSSQEITLGPLQEGNYTLTIKGQNPFSEKITEANLTFSLAPPWYRSLYAYIGYVLLIIGIIYGGVRAYTAKIEADRRRLQRLVEEQTHELRQTNEELGQVNEELKQINEELKTKNEEIFKAKQFIEEQHNSILESINYAKRIQEAILPDLTPLQNLFSQAGWFYLPKDNVSGDFYWYYRQGDCTYFAVVDCTGHGVPGAMMSMLGVSALNRIILQAQASRQPISPGKMLEQLNKEVFDTLHAKGKDSKQGDGMDIIICKFQNQGNSLQFAGARRPLWIRYQEEIREFPTTKNSIGALQDITYETFTPENPDWQQIYLFSDGVQDQLGGPKDRKLGKKNLRNILLKVKDLPAKEQANALWKFLEQWKKGTYLEQQTDDITFFTFKK